LERGQKHIGRRLRLRHVFWPEYDFQERRYSQKFDKNAAESHGFVTAQAESQTPVMQQMQYFGSAGKEASAAVQYARMMLAIGGAVGFEVAGRYGSRQQSAGAATDPAFHFVDFERRQAVEAADMVDAGGDRWIAVGQGAVEVKQDGAESAIERHGIT